MRVLFLRVQGIILLVTCVFIMLYAILVGSCPKALSPLVRLPGVCDELDSTSQTTSGHIVFAPCTVCHRAELLPFAEYLIGE